MEEMYLRTSECMVHELGIWKTLASSKSDICDTLSRSVQKTNTADSHMTMVDLAKLCQDHGETCFKLALFSFYNTEKKHTKHKTPCNPTNKTQNTLLSYETIWATKKPSYFPLYWLVNRDSHNGLL